MQKLCCVRTRQHPLPVWSHKFVLSSTTHISTNSHPFLVGIVSIMLKKKVPKRLWDYGIKWVCEVMQCTASTSGDLSGRTTLEQLTGKTPEISEFLDFTFMTGAGTMTMPG